MSGIRRLLQSRLVLASGPAQGARRESTACFFCVNYCHHCLPCPEGIEVGWVIWDLDQIPASGIEQVKDCAQQGEKMPQKSTDFSPKMTAGLTMMPVGVQERV